MKGYYVIFLLCALLVFNGCEEDEKNQIVPPVESMELIPDSVQTLIINDLSISLCKRGDIRDGYFNSSVPGTGGVFLAGLWIGMEQNGSARGNIVSTKYPPQSNYISKWEGSQLGVFSLNTENVYKPDNWPVSLGAPVDNSGFPKIYGDGMCWTVLHSDTTICSPLCFASPIEKIRVTAALYGYKRVDMANVFFIKYSITNLSSEDWNNVYTGFFSDTDLYDASGNLTGYDSTRELTYTYQFNGFNVTGFAFLETPKNTGLCSHRIVRKNNYYDPDFGESSFETPEQIIYALKGESNSGQPMINPVTGAETKFAFTGDPVTQTGWLDTPVDVRSLLSTEPFSLNAGETTWITLVWCFNSGSSLENSLSDLKNKIDQVKSENSLWNFH